MLRTLLAAILVYCGTSNASSTQWVQKGQALSIASPGDVFISSIAMSADGTVVAVGAPHNDEGGEDVGIVRVWHWDGTIWHQRGIDISGADERDQTGVAVSLSSDGAVLAVGSPVNRGQAGYVSVRQWDSSTNTWIKRGGDIFGHANLDLSGSAVVLSADGSTVVVGAPWNRETSIYGGKVNVWRWEASEWVMMGGNFTGDGVFSTLGWSVALSADGLTMAAGAPYRNAGLARVWRWDGDSWLRRGSDIVGDAEDDNCGIRVALSEDGTVLAVGADGNDAGGVDAGHIRVYQWGGDDWEQMGSDFVGQTNGDSVGVSLSLSTDGMVLAMRTRETGSVKVWRWDGTTWLQRGTNVMSETQGGGPVSLSEDGDFVAVGSSADGTVRVFSLPSPSPTQPSTSPPPSAPPTSSSHSNLVGIQFMVGLLFLLL